MTRRWEHTPKGVRLLVIDGLADDAFLIRDQSHRGHKPHPRDKEIADGYDALRNLLLQVENRAFGVQRLAYIAYEPSDPYDVIW